jgi:chemotaxis protein methyltransferase CheR
MQDLTPSELERVAELVRLESGISFRPSQQRALEAAIARAAPGEDAGGFLRLVAKPVTGSGLLQRLLDEVTVQETSFMRDPRQLDAIDWPRLVETGEGEIRIWVAGCATGEEAYTLVLLACERLATSEPPIDVLATDVSESALAAAAEGRYRTRAVRSLSRLLRDRYFTEEDGLSLPTATLRRPVRFLRHNLVRDPMPPLGEARFDLIVCRNVLIYFDGPTVEAVIASLERALKPSGMLLLGAADVLRGATRRLAEATPQPQPAPAGPARTPEELLSAALSAADHGHPADALEVTAELLSRDPLNAEVYFVRGLVQLATGVTSESVSSLRRALYIDPRFSLASFQLGRAYDDLAEREDALRAYEQALRTLDPDDDRHEALLRQVDLGDIAVACRARIEALR